MTGARDAQAPWRIEWRKGIPRPHPDGVADVDGLVPWSQIERVGRVVSIGLPVMDYDHVALQLTGGRHIWSESFPGAEPAWAEILHGLPNLPAFRFRDMPRHDDGPCSCTFSEILWPEAERGAPMYVALPRNWLARLLGDDARLRAAPHPTR